MGLIMRSYLLRYLVTVAIMSVTSSPHLANRRRRSISAALHNDCWKAGRLTANEHVLKACWYATAPTKLMGHFQWDNHR